MKFRNRLFLWISALFFMFFVFSFVFENQITKSNLKNAKLKAEKQILDSQAQITRAIEETLMFPFEQNEALIQVTLDRVGMFLESNIPFPLEQTQYSPYLKAASFFAENKWIDYLYLEDTKDTRFAIIPTDQALKQFVLLQSHDNFSFVYEPEAKKTFLAVHLIGNSSGEMVCIIFDLEYLTTVQINPQAKQAIEQLANDPNIILALSDDYKNVLSTFVESLQMARLFSFKQLFEPKELAENSAPPSIYENLLEKDMLISMLWHYLTFLGTGVLENASIDSLDPIGLCSLRFKEGFGKGFYSKDVLLRADFPIPSGQEGTFALSFQEENNFYFAKSTFLNTHGLRALTIGKRIDDVLRGIAKISGRIIAVFENNKLIYGLDANGKSLDVQLLQTSCPIPQNPGDSGKLLCQDKPYFYYRFLPFSGSNTSVMLLEPQSQALAAIFQIDKDVREAFITISFEMRLMALMALVIVLLTVHKLTIRITTPITELGNAMQQIATGKMHEIDISHLEKGNDEVASFAKTFSSMIQSLKDKEKIRSVLNKVVSAEIASEILKGKVHLGGEEKKITVFFADIRHFTNLTNAMDPSAVIALLNTCMTIISSAIEKHGGVVDKYVGDEIMALFGAPLSIEDASTKAINCALEAQANLDIWNEQRLVAGLPRIDIGIGINTGKVLAGNMGAEDRLNYTVIGREVNFAARICAFAHPQETLISPSTYEEVKALFSVEKRENIELKGFCEKFTLYKVIAKL